LGLASEYTGKTGGK